jgi:signal transduction histidine kinase
MQAGQQAALVEFSQFALAGADLPILMYQAVVLVAHTLDTAYSTIWKLLPDDDALLLHAKVGWQDGVVNQATAEVSGSSPAGYALLTKTPVIITDWNSETRFSQPPLLRDHGVISSLYVVIQGQARPFGVLGIDTAVRRTFSDAEVHFLQVIANVLALAIARGEANQTIAQQVEERTRAIEEQWVAAAQDKAVLEERQRLARDLHDSVTQALYGMTLHAQVTQELLAVGDLENATDSLRALQDTAQEALDEMRMLIFELRPPILEQVGLEAALQARLNAVEGRANLQTKLIVEEMDNLPAVIEQALYRIAQEALNNVLKHAHAQHVMVSILQQRSTAILEIVDDGIGFDPATAHEQGGQGLRGIAERVAQLNGILTLRSASGGGTQLRVEVTL